MSHQQTRMRIEQACYSAKELALVIGCSERTIWSLLKQGKLPEPVRIGGLVKWPKASIDKLLGIEVALADGISQVLKRITPASQEGGQK